LKTTKMLFLLFFFFAFFETVFTACPNGSIASFSDPTKCFYFESQKLNWIAAEESCKNLGGHLASIHDMLDNVFLSGEANTFFTDSTSADFWIGANKLFIPGNWSWSDGTPWNFVDFGKEDNISNCGALQLQNGKWIPANCLDVKPFSCLVNLEASVPITTSKPTTCLDTWTYYSGYCYRLFVDASTWLEAEDRCKVDGAHLDSIHNEDENLFVANFANYPGANVCDARKQIWTGLYTEDSKALKWKWTDGTPYDYKNWFPGFPIPGESNCAYMHIAPICDRKTGLIVNNIDSCKSVIARYVCTSLPS
jgi:hypothetical protein